MSFSLSHVRPAAGLRPLIAIGLALSVLLGSGLPVGAFQVLKDTGQRGDYFFNESESSPRVRCGYGSFVNDKSYLKWVRVAPPSVFAPDMTSDKIDSMRVGWRVIVQRYKNSTASWRTVAKSNVQKARAYENSAAPFTAIKVYHSASKISATYRALVVINWYRSDGTIRGQVRLAPDWTEAKSGTSIFPLYGPDCPGGWQRI